MFDEKGGVISTEAFVNIGKAGICTMVTTNGNCGVSKELVVTAVEPLDVVSDAEVVAIKDIKVPSFVSPNGDNINDKWVLPSEYANDPGVRVSIYTASGAEVFSTDNYQNNWLQQSAVPGKNFNSVFTI